MAKSTIIRSFGGVLMGAGLLTLIPFGLEQSGRITPFQGDLITIVGVAVFVIGGILWLISIRVKRIENDRLIESIPTLLTDIDKRREELIQTELGKRLFKGDTQFVFGMLKDSWRILGGVEFPELPIKTGEEDIKGITKILRKYINEAKGGIKKIQEKTKKLGGLEAGLLVARQVNKYIGIDDELSKDTGMRKLKKAREHLPSGVAVKTTKAIDNYLNYSRAYRAIDAIIVPLTKMVEENELLRGILTVAQVIDKFQQYREQYLEQMNLNLAKVNEALKQL